VVIEPGSAIAAPATATLANILILAMLMPRLCGRALKRR